MEREREREVISASNLVIPIIPGTRREGIFAGFAGERVQFFMSPNRQVGETPSPTRGMPRSQVDMDTWI